MSVWTDRAGAGSHRLLYLVGQLGGGGLERQLYYLLRAMDRATYRPVVAVWSAHGDGVYAQRIGELGVPVCFLGREGDPLDRARSLRRQCVGFRTEVLHSYTFYTNVIARAVTLGTGVLAVGSLRTGYHRSRAKTGSVLGRLSARWPRVQIANSHAAADEAFAAAGPFKPRQIAVVPNALDLDVFARRPLRQDDKLALLGIGSLTFTKRWDRALHTVRQLLSQGIPCELKIAGTGPLLEELRTLSQSLRIEDQVDFCGFVDDVAPLLADAHCLLHLAEAEGMPNSVMEAMAAGRPVIATPVGDIPRLVDDGVTGFLVAGDDVDQIAARVERLAHDPSLATRMGERGRVNARERFDLDRLVKETFDAYRAFGWVAS